MSTKILAIVIAVGTFCFGNAFAQNQVNTEENSADTTTNNTNTSATTHTDYSPFHQAKNPNQYKKITPTAKEDAIITKSIKERIAKSKSLSKAKVIIITNKGIVTITGDVDSDTQAGALIELSESTVGVIDVNADNLKVKASTQPLTDIVITSKVKGLLIREQIFGKDVASMNMGVETKNGVVYLSGVVNNQQQLQNAIALIQGINGVKKVVYTVKKFTPFQSQGTPAPQNTSKQINKQS